jgi:hypothetical protein
MSFQTVVGVTVRCDDCHAAASRGDQPIGVWPSTDVSGVDLPGWALDGQVHRCPSCARRRGCAAQGHRYGPWFPASAEGPVELVHRTCRVCAAEQVAPAYSQAPVNPAPAGPLSLLAS